MPRYNLATMAIKSITHRGLKRLHEEGSTRGSDARHVVKLREMLAAVDQASEPDETCVKPG